MQHLVLQFIYTAIFISLHGPAGACIPVSNTTCTKEFLCIQSKKYHGCDPRTPEMVGSGLWQLAIG